eukprot:2878937-Amphidinium_carterae.1
MERLQFNLGHLQRFRSGRDWGVEVVPSMDQVRLHATAAVQAKLDLKSIDTACSSLHEAIYTNWHPRRTAK